MQTSPQDKDRLKAWLAGQLPDDERKALEQNLAAPDGDGGSDMLRDLDRDRPEKDAALTALIHQLKTQPPDATSAPAEDAWRAILALTDDPDLIGTLGVYEVLKVIAIGGMGIVFKARDPELDREVAIKALDPELSAISTARERFLREARAAAKLEHENILPIHGVHEADGVPYFAMRLAGGGSLQDALDDKSPFDIQHSEFDVQCSIATQVSSALAAAHAGGLIHRDIKPANILFDETGENLWVCDFGIARSTEDPSLTYSGAVAGTPQYMSPEQADGKELDGRSDLFALGAVLYRCATGKQAFAGNTTAAVLKSVATADPDLSGAKLPKWFANLLGNLLAKNPRDRPRDAAAVLRAIEDKHSPRPRRRARRRRAMLVAAGILLLASLAALQLPATKRAVNSHLARDQERAFTIANRIGVHLTLADAVNAARDGDTIEIPPGEPIAVDILRIPASKRLTLTSSQSDARPLLTIAYPGAAGISAGSPLRLIGLDLQLHPVVNMRPMLRLENGGELVDCHFSGDAEKLPGPFYANPCAVEITGGELDLRGCVFERGIAVPVRAQAGSPTVRFSDCRAIGSYIIHVQPRAKPDAVTVEATGCDFSATNFYRQDSIAPVIFRGTAKGCRFASASRLAWIASKNSGTRDRFHWSGRNNTHPIGLAEAFVMGGADSGLIIPLAQRPGRIRIEGDEREFDDLAEAIDATPDGGTLLLEGDIECRTEIITPRGRAMNLRAATGAKPTVFTRQPKDHALFLGGPGTVSGIRFLRMAPSTRSQPIIAINSRGGESVVEDCEFVAVPSSFKIRNHRGVGINECRSATIRRCSFHLPGGHAILAGSRAGKITTEDCLFVSHAAIESRSADPEPRRTLSISRCVLFCGSAIVRDPYQEFPPLRAEASGNICHLLQAGFHLADIDAADLDNTIEWHARDNVYRGGGPFLQTYRARAPSGFKPVTIITDSERKRHFPDPRRISDKDFEFWPDPFWIGSYPLHLVTAQTLHDTLNSNITKSPAIATLEHFAER